jgi:hypothetical protein
LKVVEAMDGQDGAVPDLPRSSTAGLPGDEPLEEVIFWWDNSWRSALRLRKVDPHGDYHIQPKDFSDNELACFVIAITSGCGRRN